MTQKETCPECGVHSSTYYYTGRCPNGCQEEKAGIGLRNELIYAIERSFRVFDAVNTRAPGTEGVDVPSVVDTCLKEFSDWLFESSDSTLSVWELGEISKAMIEAADPDE